MLDALKQRGADAQAVDRAAEEAERTGRSIHAVLINDHVVTEEQLTEASADAYGIATLDLVGHPIEPAAVTKIPMALVLKHRVLGIALNEHEITVGITDPGDVLALDDVRAATGLTVRPVVVARSELRKIIDRLEREENDLGDVAESLRAEATPAVSNLTSISADAPIVRYVNSLPGADLPFEDHVKRRHHRAANPAERPHHRRDQPARRGPAHGHLADGVGREDRPAGPRHQRPGPEAVEARIQQDQLRAVRHLVQQAARHAALTGPTGSGKSTTLYPTLAEISKPTVNIITVEDPVEYRLAGVNQVQVDHMAGRWASTPRCSRR